ncbi:hypothetical protein SKAU_G00345140 [Synaphobranchus kaupii]|uniref:Uncharacterized protein n=1 Tax=Synaphobranchus kaupii TaxID=118154 RepID=A0A9Q1EJA9_SYNKA|nr:hypothetical protein SKAU_G00345140 [Synaphobranchus kaupii]
MQPLYSLKTTTRLRIRKLNRIQPLLINSLTGSSVVSHNALQMHALSCTEMKHIGHRPIITWGGSPGGHSDFTLCPSVTSSLAFEKTGQETHKSSPSRVVMAAKMNGRSLALVP